MNAGLTEPAELLTRDRWLERLGFEFDPFEYEAADQTLDGDPHITGAEIPGKPHIGDYFVSFPYFEKLKEPCTTFLFTKRGCGKSANYLRLERWCAETLQRPEQYPNVLAIRHDDFLRILADISLESHCQAILHRAVPALLDALFRYLPDVVGRLPPLEHEDLTWFVQNYSGRLISAGLREELKKVRAPRRRVTSEKVPEAAKGVVEAVASLFKGLPVDALTKAATTLIEFFSYESEKAPPPEKIGPLELLKRFVAIARAAGIDHTFILVDRVDEFYGTAGQPGKQAELLFPLIATIPALGIACFKFFLPSELLPHLRGLRTDKLHVLREDKMPMLEVEWRNQEIARLLETRLGSASKNHQVHFSELIKFGKERWDVDTYLVEFAYGSPRDLVRICKRIFDEHTRLPTDKLYILDSEVKDALGWFSRVRARELYGDEWLAQLLRLREMPFTLDKTTQALKLSKDETEALLQEWREKGLVKHLPRDPAQPETALLFDIADPRARLVWKEEHL
jgi:hypothetical protein